MWLLTLISSQSAAAEQTIPVAVSNQLPVSDSDMCTATTVSHTPASTFFYFQMLLALVCSAWGTQCTKWIIKRSAVLVLSYRVGSANFSQRKIGHAHDNSADSAETLQVFPNGVCTRISFFVSKTVREIRAFFSIHDQNTAETSQPQAQPTDDWRAMDRACPRGFKRPLEKFDSARLSRYKKKTGKLRE